jgi:hypothetical protein
MSEPRRSLQVHRLREVASGAARVDRARHATPAEVIDLATFRRGRRGREARVTRPGLWLWIVLVLGLVLGLAAGHPHERTTGEAATQADWLGD